MATIAITVADLRAAGLSPREIHRLQMLRDCLRCYPRIEFFANDQWKQLLFLRWRYDHGEFAGDMLPGGATESGVSVERLLEDIEGTADFGPSRVDAQ